MSAGNHFARLKGCASRARAIVEQRGLKRLHFVKDRREFIGRSTEDAIEKDEEWNASRVRRRWDGDCAREIRLPEVAPRGWRRFHLLGVVDDPDRIIAGADCEIAAAALVYRLWLNIDKVGDLRGIESVQKICVCRELAHTAIHPGNIDGGRALLLLQLR